MDLGHCPDVHLVSVHHQARPIAIAHQDGSIFFDWPEIERVAEMDQRSGMHVPFAKMLVAARTIDPRWIPVTERFPSYDESLEVLCYSESHTFGGNEHFCTLRATDFYELDPDEPDNPGTPTSKCITHWMPRPWPTGRPAPSAENSDAFRAPLHPNTDDLVNRFAAALKRKLSLAERKYGYTDGWMRKDWMNECRRHLMEHIAKGDPRDVAAYCAFLWHHGESTKP